ncbi:MAG: hypothetical protein H6912_07480 [Kordiimonadaceae bacterium]|nr:hypothetical protein [Kordiimonadaceae bacterium]
MIWIIGFTVLIFWLIVSGFIASKLIKAIQKKNKIIKGYSYRATQLITYSVIFSLPFLPDIFLHYYQKVTMPYVCREMAGYTPYNPVILTSVYVIGDPFNYLNLPNVEFTEWERADSIRKDWAMNIPVGKYRFRYYPNGSEECKNLIGMNSNINDDIIHAKQLYLRNGYPVKNTEGLCVGIKKISEFSSKYTVLSSLSPSQEDTGFGYKVYTDNTQLFNLYTSNIESQFQRIYVKSPVPFFSLLLNGYFFEIDCLPYKQLNELNNKKLNKIDLQNPLMIERGFFEFE